ncbi:peptide/nickel transport system substrate-binding protein [Pacificibacter maritimus]|uniref:Peptide/nickel transport system substrate-binding protein n=1 Tax=Pacificibacter maritimus TaxID=762213 RepID=A0A3N4UHH5_9RHOB|nr:ABC transporter substrate-binding protein [Pacificibacter maritimus]RPE66639.1 peptide/nickel transport system substrate-binding protein [Pacificibacter maritimus]
MKKLSLRTLLSVAIAATLPFSAAAETLKYAGSTAPLTFDPHATNDFLTTAIARQTYESLVELGPNMELIPGLATAWDYKGDATWRLTLREGVEFHDGTLMTAEDVAFSILRQSTSRRYKSLFGQITAANVVDDMTVDIVTSAPDAVMPVKLSRLFVMSKAWADTNGVLDVPDLGSDSTEAYSLRHANGTGPMILEEQIPGEKTTFVKNDGWWGTFSGNVDRAEYTAIGSAPTRLAALLSGEVDLITDVPLQDIERIESTDGFAVVEGPQRLFMELEMDGTRDIALATYDKEGNPLEANPFKDVRVRKAIALAVDSEAIVERVMRGHAKALSMPSAPGFYGYPEDMDVRQPVDYEQAKALLAEAGYPDGFATTLNCPLERYVNAEEICRASASLLARIGIDVSVNAMVWPEFAKMLVNGPDSSFHLIGAAGNSGDVQDTFAAVLHTRDTESGLGQQNWAMWSSPALDDTFAELVSSFDPEKRTELYRQGLKIAQDEQHAVYLHQPFITWAMDDVVNATVRADSAVVLSDVTVAE